MSLVVLFIWGCNKYSLVKPCEIRDLHAAFLNWVVFKSVWTMIKNNVLFSAVFCKISCCYSAMDVTVYIYFRIFIWSVDRNHGNRRTQAKLTIEDDAVL